MSKLLNSEKISSKDREVLRELAKRLAELAARPEEEVKRDMWRRHNALEAVRPLIVCNPENGWNEIITKDQLKCEGDLARSWEFGLRVRVFSAESMGDDFVTESYFHIGYSRNELDWGMQETKIGGENGGSYRWDAPLKDYRDMDKLKFPEIKVDYEKTDAIYNLAQETFGDILDVRIYGWWWWTLGLTMTLVHLRGLEQVMMDVYDYPDELHKIMAFLRDGHMQMLDFLEANGLLGLNTNGHVASGGLGYTNELPQKDFSPQRVRTMDMWGFAESQETTQISPAMFEEFIFPYQLPLLERFGLNCYGCCEPLNERWRIINKIPRLRRVSVSPWADLRDMAEKLGDKYVYSMKPIPTDLASSTIDEEYIRANLREAMHITRNCRVEIIMKDNHTIGNNPQNVIRWSKIAREEAERIG